ncbi:MULTISPECIES: hypothetical protein [unclassified Streptomyces]|uniref:hypothetical protein n=1 Tax=unclassified Streptomyces TaxID=2593676 RepID=UPI0029AECA0A|nr:MULTISPECIES: hypothetical protein [unclassified Streptomyces]MDX3432927.1 hypothetical protein [Streptomyces sp. ME01-18a]
MAVWKRSMAGALLLGALVGSSLTAGVMAAMSDEVVSVESHTEEPRTREDHVRQWEAALAKSGKKLPDGVEELTDQEVFSAMWSELKKHVTPEEQPTVFAN